MTQTVLLSKNVLKEGLDDFKVILAEQELKSIGENHYWRLAFWNQVNGIIPQINYFEKRKGYLDSGYLSHDWHSFPAKFYPQLVRSIMNICYVKNGLIFDPYAGCGTTLVEAKLMGLNAIGFDISKLAVLVTKVNTNLDIDTGLLIKRLIEISKKFHRMNYSNNLDFVYSDFETQWYNNENLKQLKLLKSIVDVIEETEIKNLFLVALSSILRKIANTKNGQIEVRYQLRKEKKNVLKIFEDKVRSMIYDIENYKKHGTNNKNSNINIYYADASKRRLAKNSVDFIITSPPYGNGLDYSKIHKLSIALIFGEEEIENFRNSQTGTIYAFDYDKLDIPFSKAGQEMINQLLTISPTRAKAMARYYWDMFHSIQNMYYVLKNGCNCVIIVGGTQIGNLNIDNSKILSDISVNIGFKVKNTLNWIYDKTRRSGLRHKIKGESILIFEK